MYASPVNFIHKFYSIRSPTDAFNPFAIFESVLMVGLGLCPDSTFTTVFKERSASFDNLS